MKEKRISHNKGKTKENYEPLARAGKSQSIIRKKLFNEGKIKVWNDGLTANKDERVKNNILNLKNSRIGKAPWNKRKDIREKSQEIIHLYKDELMNPEDIGKLLKCGKKIIEDILIENNALMTISESKKVLIQAGKLKVWNKNKKDIYSDEVIKKIKLARANQIFPIKDTSIEIKIQNFLKQLNIEFFTHQYMHIEHGYQCDIFIPSKNLVIECDGNYWHSYPTGTELDNIRTDELLKNGFKVLRLWEIDIKKMDLNDFQNKLNIQLNKIKTK